MLKEAIKNGKIRAFTEEVIAIENGKEVYLVDQYEETKELESKSKEYWEELLNKAYENGDEYFTVPEGQYYINLSKVARKIDKPKTLVDDHWRYTTSDEYADLDILDVPSNIGYQIIDGIASSEECTIYSYLRDGFLDITTERNAFVLGRLYELYNYQSYNPQDLLESVKNKTLNIEEAANMILKRDDAINFLSILPKHTEIGEALEMLNTYTLKYRKDRWAGELL